MLAAAGIDHPVPDGVNLLPLLTGGKPPDRTSLFWHFPHYGHRVEPNSVVRHGDLKLIEFLTDGRAELYDLAADPAETTDLARTRPDDAAKLLAELAAWRQATNAQMLTKKEE